MTDRSRSRLWGDVAAVLVAEAYRLGREGMVELLQSKKDDGRSDPPASSLEALAGPHDTA